MFIIKFFAIFAAISCVLGFQPIRVSRKVELSMSASKQPSFFKSAGIALLGASLFGSPVFAKEGAGAKFSFFGADVASSPFTVNENREDPMYSPYSAYGDGTAAVYNGRRGGNEEKSFYAAKFAEASKRVDRVPGYAAKNTWFEITTELTRYTYDLRNAALQLSKGNPTAEAAAKVYFQDLEDIYYGAVKKNGDVVLAAYKKSQADLTAFNAALK